MRQRGFTLVEVLVALVVMATMAAMAWRGIDALVKSREIAQTRLAQTMRLQTVLAQWEADLRALQESGGGVPAMAFEGGQLTLTRQQPEGMQVLVWSLRDGTIHRWASPVVRSVAEVEAQRQLGQTSSAGLKALEGLSGWQFYCYRGNAWSNCLSSAGAANNNVGPANPSNPAAPAAPPSGLRMVLDFAPGSGLSGSLTRDVEVLVQ